MTNITAIADTIIKTATATHKIPPDKRLLDAHECAEYFGVSYSTFVKDISKRPGFPRYHINLSAGKKRESLRWLASDIWRWRG